MLELDFSSFEKEILEAKIPAIVCFSASWCAPSKIQTTVLEKVALTFTDKAIIGIIDVDKNEELADRFNVSNLPTLLLFLKGELIETFGCFQQEIYLCYYIEQMLSTKAS